MEFQSQPGRLWAEDSSGKLIAEITFPEEKPGVANINHTFVDGSLRGQGVAGQLVQGAVDQLRERFGGGSVQRGAALRREDESNGHV